MTAPTTMPTPVPRHILPVLVLAQFAGDSPQLSTLTARNGPALGVWALWPLLREEWGGARAEVQQPADTRR